MEGDFINVRGCAEFLCVSTQVIYKMASERTIPHYRFGGKIMFKRSELELWVKERKVESYG